MKHGGVNLLKGVQYVRVDDAGLHIQREDGKEEVLKVDNVVICSGQESAGGDLTGSIAMAF